MRQFGVGFGDSVMAHHKFFRERTYAGQLVPSLKDASVYGVPDLLHQLHVEGLPGLRIELENDHFQTIPLLVYRWTACIASEILFRRNNLRRARASAAGSQSDHSLCLSLAESNGLALAVIRCYQPELVRYIKGVPRTDKFLRRGPNLWGLVERAVEGKEANRNDCRGSTGGH